jgi:hypothetical protein
MAKMLATAARPTAATVGSNPRTAIFVNGKLKLKTNTPIPAKISPTRRWYRPRPARAARYPLPTVPTAADNPDDDPDHGRADWHPWNCRSWNAPMSWSQPSPRIRW